MSNFKPYSMTQFRKDYETCLNIIDYMLYQVKAHNIEDKVNLSIKNREEELQYLTNLYHEVMKNKDLDADNNLLRCNIRRLTNEDDEEFRKEYMRMYDYKRRKLITYEHWQDIYKKLKIKYQKKAKKREAKYIKKEKEEKDNFDKLNSKTKITMII